MQLHFVTSYVECYVEEAHDALLISMESLVDSWVMDSGVSSHTTGNRDVLDNYIVGNHRKVFLADGKPLEALTKETVVHAVNATITHFMASHQYRTNSSNDSSSEETARDRTRKTEGTNTARSSNPRNKSPHRGDDVNNHTHCLSSGSARHTLGYGSHTHHQRETS